MFLKHALQGLTLRKNIMQSWRAVRSSRGDTIVEVLLSVSILGLVLALSFTSSSRSLSAGTSAANRNQALSYAQEQVELLRLAANNNTITNYPTDGSKFCIDPANGSKDNPSTDGFCHLNNQAPFGVAVAYNTTSQTYNVVSEWPTAKGASQVQLYYQVPLNPITAAPNLSVTLTPNPPTVPYDGTGSIDWSTNNAASCTASGGWNGNKVTSSGLHSQTFSNLTTTTTYNLTCKGTDGVSTLFKSARIYVSQLPAPTVDLTASPRTVYYGGSSTLSWSVANAASCTASGGWSGSKSASPGLHQETTGGLTSTTNFYLTCVNSDGVSTNTGTATVYIQPAPTISYFFASPNTVAYGGGTTYLYWNSTNATSCWSPQLGYLGTGGATPSGAIYGQTTYTLYCYNGQWSSPAQTTINVPLPTPVFVSAQMRWNPSINNNELHFEGLVNSHNVNNTQAYWQDTTCPGFYAGNENVPTNNSYNAVDRTVSPWSAYYCGSDTTHYFRICAYNSEGTACSGWNRYSF